MKSRRKKAIPVFAVVVMIIGILLLTMCKYPGTPERNPGQWDQAKFGTDVFGD